MSRETAEFVGNTIHYDYHLSAELPTIGIAKTYQEIQNQVWFDMHAEVEFGVVLRGGMRRWWGDTPRVLGPGDVWLCGVFERHGYRVTESPCEVVALEVSPDVVAEMFFPEATHINWLGLFTAPLARRPRTTDANRPALLDLGQRLKGFCEGAIGGAPSLERRLLLIEALHLLAGKPVSSRPVVARSGNHYARIAPAIDLALRARKPITNAEGAAVCNLSRDQFIRVFKRLLGISFTHFALRHRLQQAKSALTYTDRPIKAIAADWGFTDHSHLHRLFHEHFNCTPSDLRPRPRRSG